MKLLAYVHLHRIHNATGAGRVARNIIEQLSLAGKDEIRVLAQGLDRQALVSEIGAPWDQFQYHDFSGTISWQQARWLFVDRPPAERWWPEAQIVYCASESYVPTRRARSVVTLHDAAYFEEGALSRSFDSMRQRLKWRILHGKLERKVDMFHTVSHFSAERLAHFFPAMRSRLRVVHNGVSERFFLPPNAAGEAELTRLRLNDRPFVLLPGGLSFRKNADLVLEAWPALSAQHPDLMLVVASHCDAQYIEKAKALGPSVLLTGYVSDDVLCSLYHAARIVWFPSLYEGFGMPVLEAMACGTAVLASASSSLPEVGGDAALLIDPQLPSRHVEALDALLTDEATRNAMVERGLERSRGFTWKIAAATLRENLTELA
ncbi:MAG: glycosyltransferase family 1 protein [Sphingomonas bacterium]